MCVDAVAAGLLVAREASRRATPAATSSAPRARSPPRTKMCSADSSPTICARTSDSSARSVTRSTSGTYFARIAGPVDAVHAAVVEVVALEAPGLDEHLPPLVARIEPERPVARAATLFFDDRPAPSRRRRRRRCPVPCGRAASCGPATARSSARPRANVSGFGLLFVDGQRLERLAASRLDSSPTMNVEALAVESRACRSCPAGTGTSSSRVSMPVRSAHGRQRLRPAHPGVGLRGRGFSVAFVVASSRPSSCRRFLSSAAVGDQLVVRLERRALALASRRRGRSSSACRRTARAGAIPTGCRPATRSCGPRGSRATCRRAPRRAVAVVAIGRDRRDACRCAASYRMHARHLVRVRRGVGEPLAVGRPASRRRSRRRRTRRSCCLLSSTRRRSTQSCWSLS